MKLKNENDNRYRVRFMRDTEEIIDRLTVKEFIEYLEQNAEFEDNTVEYIDNKCVNCKAYDLKESNSNLHKEFLVTEDGRVFYWLSLINKIELVDKEEVRKEMKIMTQLTQSELEALKEAEDILFNHVDFKNTGVFDDAACALFTAIRKYERLERGDNTCQNG